MPKVYLMKKITQEELIKLAHLSRLKLEEHELIALVDEVEAVLQYAHRVSDLAQSSVSYTKPCKNVNIVRPDVVQSTNPAEILKQAPECDQNYFVVPAILETT